MKYIENFARFWWDFIVGDDWRVALGVAVAIVATWGISHEGGNAWWLLPAAVCVVLAISLWRTTREPS